jgi:hypothetical protein
MANNDNLKGRIDKWFAMTSFETGWKLSRNMDCIME